VAYAILFSVFDVHALQRDPLQVQVATGRVGAYHVVDGDVEARFLVQLQIKSYFLFLF
jgi:hypothetical protein